MLALRPAHATFADMKFLRHLTLLCLLAAPAHAGCGGKNLIEALPAPDRAALDDAVAAQPYPDGNFWQAERGNERVVLVGTYHMLDPRTAAQMAKVEPLVEAARTVLVEAGPAEERLLKDHMAKNPDAMLIADGPTLPEQLTEAEWATLSDAMRARNIPAFMAAKFQPWYVSMLLGIPPCAMEEMEKKGLDGQIAASALAHGKLLRALEPYDTVFSLFDHLTPEQQVEMIRLTLPLEAQGEDYAATLADAYFAGHAREIWEFMRLSSHDLPGYTPEKADAEFAQMEEALMAERNRNWIPVIEDAAARGPVLAAFGALHLSGRDGVLALLEREGFTLKPLDVQPAVAQ